MDNTANATLLPHQNCIDGEGQGGIPGGGPGPASWGSWGYQSCTETLHQFSSMRKGHGFRDFSFDMAKARDECLSTFDVTPDPWWSENHFGGYAIGDGLAGATNLIWSNGGLDPWHGGGLVCNSHVPFPSPTFSPSPCAHTRTWLCLWAPNRVMLASAATACPDCPLFVYPVYSRSTGFFVPSPTASRVDFTGSSCPRGLTILICVGRTPATRAM